MYIEDCNIPFHDLEEVVEFLLSLSPVMATIFDGCYVRLSDSCLIQYYYIIPSFEDFSLFWTYKIYRVE